MAWLKAYDRNGALIEHQRVSWSEYFKRGTSAVVDFLDKELARCFVVSSFKENKISPKVLFPENYFLLDMIPHRERAIVTLVLDDYDDFLNVKQYQLPELHLLNEWQIKEPLAYVFSDCSKIMTCLCGNLKTYAIKDLNSSCCSVLFPWYFKDIDNLSVLEDGNLMASSGEDNLVKVWHIERGACLETIEVDDYPEHLILATTERIIG